MTTINDIQREDWSKWVGILTVQQKDSLLGIEYTNSMYFNPVQDKWDRWFISIEEITQTTHPNFQWVKELELVPYEPKEYPNPFGGV